MPDHKKRAATLLFYYETTTKTDFRSGKIKPIVTTVYKSKPACPRPTAKPLKDLHAMTEWRVANIPFDLYHKPKDIVRTHPKHIQEVYMRPEDLEREQIQKTRPRIVMTPAVPIDDFEDPVVRKNLTDDVYTTAQQRCLRSVKQPARIQAPFADHCAPAQPITIEPLLQPLVSGEWRMESAAWDRQQLRTSTHATKQFWLNREHKPKKFGSTFHFA